MWQTILDNASKLGTAIVTIGSIIFFIIGLVRGWWKGVKSLSKLCKVVDKLDDSSKRIICFMDEMMPDILSDLEEKNIIGKGRLPEWTRITSSGYAQTHSPVQLGDLGKCLLEESGIKKIIDDHLEEYINKIKETNPPTIIEVEQNAFYILNDLKNNAELVGIKLFAYNNPIYKNQPLTYENIILVGSLYLRDKYKEVKK